MKAWWRQFRSIGIPRCPDYGENCGGLIWPWQGWVCPVEEWPRHHRCYHRYLDEMREYVDSEERYAQYRTDDYDKCRWCDYQTTGRARVVAAA